MNPDIVDVGKKTQFKPGQSGNPAGPPHRRRIRDLLVAVLEVPLSPEALKLVRPDLRARLREGETYADLLIESIILRGLDKADVTTCREGFACEDSAAGILDFNQARGPDSSQGGAAIRQGARAGRRLPISCLSSSHCARTHSSWCGQQYAPIFPKPRQTPTL
jgi:hypothetical protein